MISLPREKEVDEVDSAVEEVVALEEEEAAASVVEEAVVSEEDEEVDLAAAEAEEEATEVAEEVEVVSVMSTEPLFQPIREVLWLMQVPLRRRSSTERLRNESQNGWSRGLCDCPDTVIESLLAHALLVPHVPHDYC